MPSDQNDSRELNEDLQTSVPAVPLGDARFGGDGADDSISDDEGGSPTRPPIVDDASALDSPAQSVASDETTPDAIVEGGDEADAAVIDEPAASRVRPGRRAGEWEHELSAQKVAAELKHLEDEVRQIIEERDAKRKRKFTGTSRWNELEDDLIAWRFGGRFDEDTLRNVQRLISRRHYLFRHLRFLATTRHGWNS